jgi:hypothetical protein
MTGPKTLGEVRAELEAALHGGPAGKGEVRESLRRFLAAGSSGQGTQSHDQNQNGGRAARAEISDTSDLPPTGELSH